METDYEIGYYFAESKKSLVYRVGVDLISENNSFCGFGYYDGYNRDYFAHFGERISLVMNPQKFIFIKGSESCRESPYNDLFYEKMAKRIQENCTDPCRTPNHYLCKYIDSVGNLSICENDAELKCFDDAKEYVKKEMTEKSLLKPCTKVQYKAETIMWPIKDNQMRFSLEFIHPPAFKVKEEYIIYDLVSMIGAIGGTMGICIGFSFREITGLLIKCLGILINKLKITNDLKNPDSSLTKEPYTSTQSSISSYQSK